LGSTPPPYQLFDYLQSLNDQKSKYLYDKTIENDNNLSIHNTDATAHQPILNAIKAISGMSEYDIAPSKTIAGIIPLLGFGGIVAQKLEANGYVKFANGFCIQWGNYSAMPIDTTTRKINFNISMTHLCSIVTPNCYDIPDTVISPYVADADSSGIYVLIDFSTGQGYTSGSSTSNILWIALGIC